MRYRPLALSPNVCEERRHTDALHTRSGTGGSDGHAGDAVGQQPPAQGPLAGALAVEQRDEATVPEREAGPGEVGGEPDDLYLWERARHRDAFLEPDEKVFDVYYLQRPDF